MKKLMLTLVMLSFINVTLATCAPVVVYVAKKPPAPKVVKICPKPYPHAVWISGHWKYSAKAGKFIWVNGHWTKNRKGHVWVKGHWVKKPRGWVYVAGHWRK